MGLVLFAAGVVRLAGLSRPTGLVFDEIFYARDGCWYVAASEAVCGISDLTSRAHPPLGKWLVGSGIAVFGYEPFGWRVGVAIAGVATVALVFLLARLLLRGAVAGPAATVGATTAAGLLATDFLHVVHSRVAMLDAFIVLFVVGAILAVVLDRDRDRAGAGHWTRRLVLDRPWRLVAGACIGAAAATKWSGAYVAPAIVLLVVAWEIAVARRARPEAGWGSVVRDAARREALPTVIFLGLVPLLVYVASYAGRMPGEVLAAPWQAGSVWRGIYDHQRAMLDFHTTLAGDHPYQSPPWSWPLIRQPVAYWFSDEGGTYREILALGNPVVWWAGIASLGALLAGWWRSGWRPFGPEVVVLAAAVSTYVPWLVLSGQRSQVFLWYFLPTVPFLCLAIGVLAARAWNALPGRVAVLAYAALVMATFLFYFPLLTALPVERDAWRMRIVFTDCSRPGAEDRSLPDAESSQGPAPDGWCWI